MDMDMDMDMIMNTHIDRQIDKWIDMWVTYTQMDRLMDLHENGRLQIMPRLRLIMVSVNNFWNNTVISPVHIYSQILQIG